MYLWVNKSAVYYINNGTNHRTNVRVDEIRMAWIIVIVYGPATRDNDCEIPTHFQKKCGYVLWLYEIEANLILCGFMWLQVHDHELKIINHSADKTREIG